MTLEEWAQSQTHSRAFPLFLSNAGVALTQLLRLIFPRWDVIAIVLSIFLLTYTYIEAKSNYHRGSILILR